MRSQLKEEDAQILRKRHKVLYIKDKSLTTVSTEGLILSFMIDAMEGRDVENSDIPGAFLQTYYEKRDVCIKMEVEMVNLPEKIYPF